MAKKYMNKNILILLFPLIICGCNSTSTTITPSTSLYLGEYGDIMNDFLPNEGEVKLLFKHSEEETVGDDGEDYFYNYCPSIFIENIAQIKTGVVLLIILAIEAVKLKIINYIIRKNN